ncbi:universal stress protein [uncultured Brevundimonas sp.]|uniref:universal stress protein n=1 Tax=uncultured Brevundimonas sp. TaxID=213418 RepID=UPI0025E8D499|nr:universal stress protein [uncultured Brevundimonas sp.]
MTWSSLIVYVDDEPDNTQRIEQACDLAKAHGAHLIGVSACAPETPVADAYGAGILMGEVLTAQHERAESALKGAEERFRDLATRAGVSCEWRADVGDPTSLLVKHARAADVLIVGRDSANASGWRAPIPSDLAMRAGRSILIMPPNPARPVVGAPVLLAWTDSRESRLAAVAAIPLLREAESVRVLELCDPEDVDGARLRTADVAAWLRRHGVNAEPDARAHDDRAAGRRLLDYATEMKAGAVVSGAWGHARMRQWIFGGVTQTLITESPVALLLAH